MSFHYILPKTADNADAQLDSGIGASATTITVESGQGDLFPQIYRDTTTSAGTSTALNKTGIGAVGIEAGDFIENITDGSCAFVVSVDTNSLVTTLLKGGSDNTWQSGDEYAVNRFIATLSARNASGQITKSEKVLIGDRSGDSLTVETSGRGYDGSTATSFNAGDYCSIFVKNLDLQGVREALAQMETDKANLTEVQALFAGRSWKDPVVAASISPLTLATDVEAGDTLDDVTLVEGDRIGIFGQTDSTENGIYEVAASGAPSRTSDADTGTKLTNAIVAVVDGTTNGDKQFMCTSDNPTIGSDNIVFTEVSAAIQYASQAEAEAGTNNTKVMTPLRVSQALSYAESAKIHKFTSKESWSALSVSGATPVQIVVDATDLTGGKVKVTADGTITDEIEYGDKDYFFVDVTSSLEIDSDDLGWLDIDNMAYDSISLVVSSQDGAPRGIAYSADGTKLYVVGGSNKTVYQYTLSTPWSLSGASYASKSFSVNSQDATPQGIFFNPTGTKMYMVGSTNDTVYQYTLGTAWDISTASYASKSIVVSTEDSQPSEVFIDPTGTKMYVMGNTTDKVYQYTLGTAWDLSTASYASIFFSVTSQETSANGLFFKNDGTKMYVIGDANDTIYQYTLSTPWNVGTATYDSKSYSVGGLEDTPHAICFGSEGRKVLVVGITTDTVYQYSLVNTYSGTAYASIRK